VAGIGPQIGYIFPLGRMQGYRNFKDYAELAAADRPSGWKAWVTLVISQRHPLRLCNQRCCINEGWRRRRRHTDVYDPQHPKFI